MDNNIIVIGINHRSATIELREKVSFSQTQIKDRAEELKNLEGVSGIIVLSTCNRTEVYFSTNYKNTGVTSVLDFICLSSGSDIDCLRKHIYIKENEQAVHHLMKVASGLDSMILGESQILGQIENLYNCARDCKLSDNVLNTLFQKAISTGKRVRTHTSIDRNALSVGSVAVIYAKKIFGCLKNKKVLVLGAGETGELTIRHLVANGVRTVIVANRTYENACKIAREFSGKAIRFNEFTDYLKEADIVIGCTAAPHNVVNYEDVLPIMKERKGRPLLFIDIAVPRDIQPEVANIENVSLCDIDSFQSEINNNKAIREMEAHKAEKLINEEVEEYMKWWDALYVVPIIKALKDKAEDIKEQEVNRALKKLDSMSLTDKEKNIIHSLAHSIVNKILSDPIVNLKEYALSEKGDQYLEALQKLFNLDNYETNNHPLDREGIV